LQAALGDARLIVQHPSTTATKDVLR